MTHRSSSPPLIKEIDGIVSRSPNEVNYSSLNGKRMETGKQQENEIRRKYKKHGISGNKAKYVKQEENTGKSKIWWNQSKKTTQIQASICDIAK